MLSDRAEMLTTKQVAALIGRSEDWVYSARAKPGEGPPHYRMGGRVIYMRQDVMKWFETCRVE